MQQVAIKHDSQKEILSILKGQIKHVALPGQ